MLKRITRTKDMVVEFCDRCSSVCTAACRADGLLARSLEESMVESGRLL